MFYLVSVGEDGTPQIGASSDDHNALTSHPPYSIIVGANSDADLQRTAKQMVDGEFIRRRAA